MSLASLSHAWCSRRGCPAPAPLWPPPRAPPHGERWKALGPSSGVLGVGPARRADQSIHFYHGYFDLREEEALLVLLRPPKCVYWNFQVNFPPPPAGVPLPGGSPPPSFLRLPCNPFLPLSSPFVLATAQLNNCWMESLADDDRRRCAAGDGSCRAAPAAAPLGVDDATQSGGGVTHVNKARAVYRSDGSVVLVVARAPPPEELLRAHCAQWVSTAGEPAAVGCCGGSNALGCCGGLWAPASHHTGDWRVVVGWPGCGLVASRGAEGRHACWGGQCTPRLR